MWFELLPSMGIIFTMLSLPSATAYVYNQLLIGNHYRRRIDTFEQCKQYLRDRRLTGDPYKVGGLESISDE